MDESRFRYQLFFFVDKIYERLCWHYERAYFVNGFYKILRNYEVSRTSIIKNQVLLRVFFSGET